MIEKIGHYSIQNNPTIYDEEALTALELAGRTAAKVNEVVGLVNQNEADVKEMRETQLPAAVKDEVLEHIEGGTFDQQIDQHTTELTQTIQRTERQFESEVADLTNQLTGRIDALARLSEGSTTGDAELVDARTDIDGTVHTNAGKAVRSQAMIYNYNFVMYGYTLDIDLTAKTALIKPNASTGKFFYTHNRRDMSTKAFSATITPETLDFSGLGSPIGIYINIADANNAVLFAKTISSSGHTPTKDDVLLCTIYNNSVHCVSVAPSCLKVNGKLMQPDIKTTRNEAYSGNILFYGTGLVINYNDHRATIYKGTYFTRPFYATGVNTIANNLSLTYEVNNSVQYLVFDSTTYTMSVVDRNYEFNEKMFCLGALFMGKFIPVEICPDCVTYIGGTTEKTKHTYMHDFFAPLGNPDTNFKITLVGDSITMGAGGTGYKQEGDLILDTGSSQYYRNPNGYCWAKLFKEYIESNYNATVINNGISGLFSGQLNTYKETIIPADSDLVICTIGTNNRNAVAAYGITTAEQAKRAMYNHLTSIINYCKGLGVPVLLCTCIPADKENQEDTDRLCNMSEINMIIERVASEFDMDFADIHNEYYYYFADKGLNYAEYLADGLHPNDAGYRILFYRYLKAFGLPPHYETVD